MISNGPQTRRSHPALAKLTLAALVFTTLAYASEFALLGLDREIGIVIGCLGVASVLVTTGWRWTPALGALLTGSVLLGNPWLLHNLSLPVTSAFFLAAAAQVLCSLVVVVAGTGATLQSYWSGRKKRAF